MINPLSRTFKSLKPLNKFDDFGSKSLSKPPKSLKLTSNSSPSSSSSSLNSPEVSTSNTRPLRNPWSVYLILSTNPPFKTYVGATTNFSRRYIPSLIFSFLDWWIEGFWATKYHWFNNFWWLCLLIFSTSSFHIMLLSLSVKFLFHYGNSDFQFMTLLQWWRNWEHKIMRFLDFESEI